MKKSVYSLVLLDDIVEAIDQLAYSLNTNRSNLINQILAEKVALSTPEQHLQSVFNQLSDALRPYSHFQIQTQAADHMYSIKSAIKFKYNPTIKYSYYLNQHKEGFTGELRIISRTQSEVLHGYLSHFFSLWSRLENEKLGVKWKEEEGSKWLRTLHLEAFKNASDYKCLGSALSHYVKALDQGLKIYFKQIEEGYEDPREISVHYNEYYEYMPLHI